MPHVDQTKQYAARLRRLVGEGLSLARISERLRRRESTVRGWLRKLGLSPADGKANPKKRAPETCEPALHALMDARRAACDALGWPELTRPAEARVCQALLEGGPLTHRQIALAIGWRLNRRRSYECSGPLQRRLARLAVLGYVVKLPKTGGQTPRYDLSPRVRARKQDDASARAGG